MRSQVRNQGCNPPTDENADDEHAGMMTRMLMNVLMTSMLVSIPTRMLVSELLMDTTRVML